MELQVKESMPFGEVHQGAKVLFITVPLGWNSKKKLYKPIAWQTPSAVVGTIVDEPQQIQGHFYYHIDLIQDLIFTPIDARVAIVQSEEVQDAEISH